MTELHFFYKSLHKKSDKIINAICSGWLVNLRGFVSSKLYHMYIAIKTTELKLFNVTSNRTRRKPTPKLTQQQHVHIIQVAMDVHMLPW